MTRNKYTYYDENGNQIKAYNYIDAAEKLYGQEEYTLPERPNTIYQTTYVASLKGYGYVWVYEVGDDPYGCRRHKVKTHILKKKHRV